MKKIFNIIILASLILLVTGCNKYSEKKVEKVVTEFFKDEFKIETISTQEYDKGYILKMKTDDDCIFYVKSEYGPQVGGFSGTVIYTNILNSYYQKNKTEITRIANNKNLEIEFNEIDDNSIPDFTQKVIIVKADKSQLTDVKEFITDVINIPDINKLYNILYGSGSYSMSDTFIIDDNSEIIIYEKNEEINSLSIFYGYKNFDKILTDLQ